MPKHPFRNLFLFIYSLNRSDWVSITGSLGSAVIAAVISLFVVYLQANQQDKKEEDAKNYSEQNKLKYLHFLIIDTFTLIDNYDLAVQNFTISVSNNPFIIPDLPRSLPSSLNIIANKIDQQEYYLASINQFENEDVVEIFKLSNYLSGSYTEAICYYQKEFLGLIDVKKDYINSYEKLIESTNSYLIKTYEKATDPVDIALSREINEVMGNLIQERKVYDRMTIVKNSKDNFASKIQKILNPRGEVKYRELMLEADGVIIKYNAPQNLDR